MSAFDLGSLLEQCRQTHEADLAELQTRVERLARDLPRRVVYGGVSREEFSDFIRANCTPALHESLEMFEARHRGLMGGLVAGMSDLAAR